MKSYELLELWLSNRLLEGMLMANEHLDDTQQRLLRDSLIRSTLGWLRDNWPTGAYSMATAAWIKHLEESEYEVTRRPPELVQG